MVHAVLVNVVGDSREREGEERERAVVWVLGSMLGHVISGKLMVWMLDDVFGGRSEYVLVLQDLGNLRLN